VCSIEIPYIINGDRISGDTEEGFGGDIIFSVLEGGNPIFDGVTGVNIMNMNGFGLTEAMASIMGLFVEGFIPPGVKEDNMIGLGDI
jgi:hypothetical protein